MQMTLCDGAQEATNSAPHFQPPNLGNLVWQTSSRAKRFAAYKKPKAGTGALQPPECLLHTLRYRNPALLEGRCMNWKPSAAVLCHLELVALCFC